MYLRYYFTNSYTFQIIEGKFFVFLSIYNFSLKLHLHLSCQYIPVAEPISCIQLHTTHIQLHWKLLSCVCLIPLNRIVNKYVETLKLDWIELLVSYPYHLSVYVSAPNQSMINLFTFKEHLNKTNRTHKRSKKIEIFQPLRTIKT